MWSSTSLVVMITVKQLLGYVLHPVGVEMCRQFCCQVTGRPFCVYSPTGLLCQATHRNRLQADDQWTILEISTRIFLIIAVGSHFLKLDRYRTNGNHHLNQLIYKVDNNNGHIYMIDGSKENGAVACATVIEPRTISYRLPDQSSFFTAALNKSVTPFLITYSDYKVIIRSYIRDLMQTKCGTTMQHWAIYEAKATSCAVHSRLHRSRTKGVKCVADLTKDYRRGTVGRETIYIKRIYFAMRWDTANKICERDGGQLVKVDNKETLEEVTKLFNPFDSLKRVEVWIGLRDLCNNNTFLWLDGQAPTFTKWAPEEATRYNEGGRQGKCVKMRLSFTGMNWLSASCNSKRGYICQLLLPDNTTTLPKGEICCGSLKQTLGTSTFEIKEMH